MKRAPFVASVLACCGPAVAQRIVADASPGQTATPAPIELLGQANGRELLTIGNQLWSTDGTAAQTLLLGELAPDNYVAPGALVGSRLVVPAVSRLVPGLRSSDGLTAGFPVVANLERDPNFFLDRVTSAGARGVFAGFDRLSGVELWTTDGTTAGTRRLADFYPGEGGSWPNWFTRSGGLAYYFSADVPHGYELWRSDGTLAGTFLVGELVPGPEGVSDIPQRLPFPGGLLVPYEGRLWSTDGSPGSLAPYVTLPPGAFDLARLGTRTLFQSGADLWGIDGNGAVARVRTFATLQLRPRKFEPVELAGALLFAAADSATGLELWRTDGTAAGTSLVADILPGSAGSAPQLLFAQSGRAYFLASAGPEGAELWSTDGTASGTQFVADLTPGPDSSVAHGWSGLGGRSLLAVGDSVNGARRVWSVAPSGANLLIAPRVLATPTVPQQVTRADDGIALRYALYGEDRLARVAAGQFVPLGPGGLFAAREQEVLFFAELDLRAHDLARGTRHVTSFSPGYEPRAITGALGAYFLSIYDPTRARVELWRSDATWQGTSALGLEAPTRIVEFGDRLVLLYPDRLVVHDGARPLVTIPSFANGNPEHAVATSSAVLFTLFGRQLWSTDGTPAGTRFLRLLAASSRVVGLASSAERAFALTDRELVASDGTPSGTYSVRGFESTNPREFVVLDRRALFVATELATGEELWVSDGTTAGTITFDLLAGADGSFPSGLTVLGDRIAFAANDPAAGREPWVSDGTRAGTRRVADLRPGIAGSQPGAFVRAGATVHFIADDGVVGAEPWIAPVALFGAAALDVLPGACSGAAGLPQLRGDFPRLGDRGYALAVGSARAASPGVLLVGAVAPAAVPGACALRVAPVVSLPFATTALGAAQVTLPIPPQPSLLGVALGTQAAVVDPAGGLLGVASLTDGLRLVIGR